VTLPSFFRKFLRTVAWWFVGILLLLVALIFLFRFVNPPTTTFMLGYEPASPDQELRQEWVSLSDISPSMPLAVVASEDQQFLHHRGVDFEAIGKALAEYRAGQGLRGASTITQQTAKNLFLWSGRSFVRKALEAGLGIGIDALWPKRRIIEVYLNIAEFGPGIYGVEAASQTYFGIPASELSPSQAARLAAVLPNPKNYSAANPSPYVWQRVAWIRGQMAELSRSGHLRELYE
jgi:monofunctional biosynthetic peptidoglycan transglycosylase